MNPISNLLKRVVSGGGGFGRDGDLLNKFLSHTRSSSPITPNPIKPNHPIQLQNPKSLSTSNPSPPPPSPPPPSSSSTTTPSSSSSSDSHPSSKMQRLDFVWKILLLGNFAIFGYILMNMESKDSGKKKDEGKKKGEVDHVGEAPKPQVHYVYMDVHIHDDREK